MKNWQRVLLITGLSGGLACANQITLDCISAAPANMNYWTTFACYMRDGTLNLVALSLQNTDNAQPTKDDGRIKDTRTEPPPAPSPDAMIGGMPVFLSPPAPVAVVAVAAASSSKTSQGAGNQAVATNNSSNSSGAANPTNNTATSSSGSSGNPQPGGGGDPAAAVMSEQTLIQNVLAQSGPPQLFSVSSSSSQANSQQPVQTLVTGPLPPIGSDPVPEPGVFLLSALGLGGIAWRVRRRTA